MVIGDEMYAVPADRSLEAVILPRLRSGKNSGRSAEDILDDVDSQAVLVGGRREPLAVSPECHEVLDLDLRPSTGDQEPSTPRTPTGALRATAGVLAGQPCVGWRRIGDSNP